MAGPAPQMSTPTPDPEMLAALARLGLVAKGETAACEPLTGGVSSDIWKITTLTRTFCVKRALARLKVAQEWHAPVARSRAEYDWLAEAAHHAPTAVPKLMGYDAEAQLFALEWLDPARYRWWKGLLRDGEVDPATAATLGAVLVRIHAGTARRDDIARRFATDDVFYAIRLEPYLVATAHVHADRADRLVELVKRTATTRRALVHGDVSPKNILIGPDGPVLLDAECAWYGDPAFDLAFCLNHLLLKGLWNRKAGARLLDAFDALHTAHAAGIAWEPPADMAARIAHLLPGLLLARVDGKSPVEYLTDEADRDLVRRVARDWLAVGDRLTLATIRDDWAEALRAAR
jgi:aminoglycoside phosphotransferase (APT) family kinase protein